MEILWLCVGVGLGAIGGAVIGWLLAAQRKAVASETERAARMAAETRAAAAEQTLAAVRVERDTAAETAGRLGRDSAALRTDVDHWQRIALERQRERDAVAALLDSTRGERDIARQDVATLTEQRKADEARLAEQRGLIARSEERLREAFDSLSAKALGANNESFLKLAQQSFQTLLAEAKGEGEKRHQAIGSLTTPIRELLEKQAQAIAELERKREGAYQSIDTQIKSIVEQGTQLRQETGRLVTALRRPEQRGRWGELQLRNTVELAGMTAHCDFEEQVHVAGGEEGALRPDMTVRLPGGGLIVVDSKVALDAYLDSLQPDANRDECLKRHVSQIESHISRLAKKAYWDSFETSPKLVVLFIPLEAALSAACDLEPNLHARAMEQHVLIATPTLLVALLRAVAYGWRQEDVAKNSREIAQAGRDIYDRLAVFAKSLGAVGKSLSKATGDYNSAIGSLEARVLPAARKLAALGAANNDALESPALVEIETRPIVASELTRSDESEARTLPEAT